MIQVPADQQFYLDGIDMLRAEISRLGLSLPVAATVTPLGSELPGGAGGISNRMVAMAGPSLDHNATGTLSEATRTRYRRWVEGGHGMIRTEPFAVRPAERQPYMDRSQMDTWREWVQQTQAAGARLCLQVETVADGDGASSATTCDDWLETAVCAAEAGIDVIMLNASNGSMVDERQVRCLEQIMDALRSSGISTLGVRFCAYDAMPGGFGTEANQYRHVDTGSVEALVSRWVDCGITLVEVTTHHPALRGDPRQPLASDAYPHEHPLTVLARRMTFCRAIKQAAPNVTVLSEGFSWLRQYMPWVAAGLLEEQTLDLVGLGRFALAYPHAPADLLANGELVARRCCIQCGACSALRKQRSPVRCLVHTGRHLDEWSAQLTPPALYVQYPDEDALAVRQLYYDAARQARAAGITGLRLPDRPSGRRMAVIGGGPCGIAATAELLEQGHAVTLFEAHTQLGGMPEQAIPAFRFTGARAIIDALFETALQRERLVIKLESPLQSAPQFQRLCAEFDAVLLATGLWDEPSLGTGAGIWSGVSFLRHLKQHGPLDPPPRRAVLLSGGDAATDCAVQLRDAGANPLYVVYPGPRDAMLWCMSPSWLDQPGIELLTHTEPLGYCFDESGRVAGLRVRREQQCGGDGVLSADTIIEAQGLQVAATLKDVLSGIAFTDTGLLATAAPGSYATSQAGVYAAGAVINGGASVAQCIEEGRLAALEIHTQLNACK